MRTSTPVVRYLHAPVPTAMSTSSGTERPVTLAEISVTLTISTHMGLTAKATKKATKASTQKKRRQHTPQQHLE